MAEKDKELLDRAIDFIVETQESDDYICEQMIEGFNDYCTNNCQTLNKDCVKLFLLNIYKSNSCKD